MNALFRNRAFLISVLLALTTLASYWDVLRDEFVSFDDSVYITENPNVQAGLTSESMRWAFSTGHAGNWHPVTWLSHMLDYQLYGMNPTGHHLTNVLLHVLNSVLLFLVFRRMTGALWQSAFVAAVFAFHPLHVESVAWAAERKDVLSALFWILTMWGYIAYVEKPAPTRYIVILLLFSLGLMAKPMLVTLPFVLLLLDYWPLRRFEVRDPEVARSKPRKQGHGDPASRKLPVRRLVREKLLLFVAVLISSVITLYVQQRAGAVQPWESMSFTTRIANALVAYIKYITKTFWPSGLSVIYPHPGSSLPLWQPVGSGILLVCLTVLVLWMAKRRRYLATGWLWYLGTLVPVIGIIQVGSQAMADRYMCIPLIGLSIVIAWGFTEILRSWRYRAISLAVGSLAAVSGMIICTRLQEGYWSDSMRLFQHAIDVTENNWLAHNNLGVILEGQGKITEAITHYSKSVQINPIYAVAHYNLGNAVAKQGQIDEAMTHYIEALRIDPNLENAHLNLGFYLAAKGRLPEAITQYSDALRINPNNPVVHYHMGLALSAQGKIREAIAQYSEAVRLKPDYVDARNHLAAAEGDIQRQTMVKP